VGEPAPPHLPGPRPAVSTAGEPPPGERAGHPVGRPGGGERGEHVGDCRGDFLVGVDDHGAVLVVNEPDGQRDAQLTAARRGPFRLIQPAGQPVELSFGHLALQTQEEPVVDVGQLIDAVAVDDQGAGQAGQLQQAGQVRVGAGKPGHLQPEHRTDLAHAHPGDQLLEPFPVGGAAPRQPQIAVDHLDARGGPAQPGGQGGQAVLPRGGLGVLADLHQAGLADVADRGALPVRAGHLRLAAHHRTPPPARPQARTRPCWPAARPSPPTPPRSPATVTARTRRRQAPATPAPAGPAARG
jgi:hypothetical protein